MDQTVVTLQTHITGLYLVSVHQRAPPLSSDSSRLIAAYYSFIDPREDERLSWPSWLAYSGRFTQINGYPSATGQGKLADQRPTFYH